MQTKKTRKNMNKLNKLQKMDAVLPLVSYHNTGVACLKILDCDVKKAIAKQ